MSTRPIPESAEHSHGAVSHTVELRMSIADVRRILGARVRDLRDHAQQSVNTAASEMRMSPERLQHIEDGDVDVSLDELVRIADGLGVAVETLFVDL